MRTYFTSLALLFALAMSSAVMGQSKATPKDMVSTYENLADAILALRNAEENFVRAILAGHRRSAESMYESGNIEGAAAEMALFANEGDNAVGGVRKRLLEGGHHHNAAGEAKGIYEPGFVIVTREAKKTILEAASALQRANNDNERNAAWQSFLTTADALSK